ncbi:MAG: hypothetical protein KGJ23_00345 [Euryarchaeota archaeon]|nr:hypothetical protein [Euryarchaeota archaeon]MDE1835045.1 hypothetical protein [Euryarchaeota archaeon]MDE1879316.1 hypothetical protein [Euryarchaeota archaeon]MDE2044884.1 hypothetical protein [Thermoplasmata archaeon]
MSATELEATLRSAPLASAPAPPPQPLPRLVIAGGTGRLGSALVRSALGAGFPVTAVITGPRAGSTRAPVDRWGPGSSQLPLLPPSELTHALERADLFVSAATPAAEATNLPAVASRRIPAVIATTGLEGTPAEEALDLIAQVVPLVVDSNFSVGAHLLFRAASSLGPLPEAYDLSITETHRRGKRDCPSGTARTLAAALAPSGVRGWAPATGERHDGCVEIASLRAGDVPGIHTLQVAGYHEVLRFEHVAFGREAFADGILEAARWLHAPLSGPRAPGRYGLEDVLASRRSAPTADPRP